MHAYQDIGEGEIYGEWVIVGPVFRQTRKVDGAIEWFAPCRCSCGNYKAVRTSQLRSGHSRSCGWCAGVVADGQRIYTIWRGMLMRCTNPSHKQYENYGGRGIHICDEWQTNFKAFKSWSLNNGYMPGLQIDRIDNDGPYSPENCQWITNKVNNRNKRTNVMISAFGETKCLMDWVKDPRCSISFSTLRHRLKQQGMSPESAISTPPMEGNDHRWNSKKVTIRGETKSITAWANDPRCTLGRAAIAKRLKKGMLPEEAIFKRSRKPRELT